MVLPNSRVREVTRAQLEAEIQVLEGSAMDDRDLTKKLGDVQKQHAPTGRDN